jgi:hypothetical protein
VTHRIEHALVMDTDDMPGRGGYAVVGLSDGLEQAERVFVSENFGISDFLHDPRNDRVFYSFFRVPNGRRRAFVRRFVHGTRRNATQNRVFVHTLFLEDATFDALHRLPWLLADATFSRAGESERHPLRLDPADPLLDLSRFTALEWSPEPALLDGIAARFRKRLEFLDKRLPNAASAVAATIGALQRQRPVLLPQGGAYEQVVLLAWSMLPPPDRAEIAWTQHDAQNVHIAFELASTPAGGNVDLAAAPDEVARRIVEMNVTSEETHAEFHRRTARYDLHVRGDAVRAWFAWRDQLTVVGSRWSVVGVEELEALARTIRPDRGDPWVDGEEILELLWPAVEDEVRGGRSEAQAVNRWASLFERSGLGARIFAAPPRQEWLDRVSERFSADALVRFFTFGADAGPAGVPVRDAVAAWLIAKRPGIAPDVLARFATQLARDRSSRVEPIVRRLFESPDGLRQLAEVTPLNAEMGDLVLLATLVAIQNAHPWTAGYVIGTLLRHLELSTETRTRVNAAIADSVAAILRDDTGAFVRFVSLLSKELQERLVNQAVAWGDRELQRDLAARTIDGGIAVGPHTSELVFALANAGERAPGWGELLLRIAGNIDAHRREDVMRRFDERIARLDASRVDLAGLLEQVVAFLRRPDIAAGSSLRTLLSFTESEWSADVVPVVAGQVLRSRDVAAWDTLVARLASAFGRAHRDDTGKLVVAFWNRLEPRDVPNVSQDVIDAASRLEGARREAFVEAWTRRIGALPRSPRSEQLIAVVEQLQEGDARDVRIARNRRTIELGGASFETLNELDDDLWNDDDRTYGERIESALVAYAGTSPLKRAHRLIDLLANPHVLPSVKLAVETYLPFALHDLAPRDWNELVKTPPAKLFCRGSLTMIVARRLGATRDAGDAAADLESIVQRMQKRDALDALAAGRIDAEPQWRKWVRKMSGRLRMTTNGPVPM